MASKTTARSLRSLTRQAGQRCSCATPISSRSNTVRQFSISASRSDTQYNEERGARPRWSYTPPQMKLPFNPRANHDIPTWEVNSDPERLNRFYIQFLGRGGDEVLTDEVKWLAITHKSFDQGRRGFNDRLAYFGAYPDLRCEWLNVYWVYNMQGVGYWTYRQVWLYYNRRLRQKLNYPRKQTAREQKSRCHSHTLLWTVCQT